MKSTAIHLAQGVLSSGNTIRRVVQWPILSKLLFEQHYTAAVDVGAGGGIYSCGMYLYGLLEPHCQRVVAIDYSEEYCSILRNKAREAEISKVEIMRASGDHLPLPSDSFDLVLSTEVLTYLPSDVQGLSEVCRILKPSGRAIISVPLLPEPCSAIGALRSGYTRPQIVDMLTTAGFSIRAIHFCMFGITKLVMRLSCPLWQRSNGTWSLPLLWLIYFERWGARWGKPYDIILDAYR